MNRLFKKVVAPIITVIYTLTTLFSGTSFVYGDEIETTYYFLNDHLGNVDMVLDDEGNVVERVDYLPYGDDRLRITETGAPDTDYGFTGKEKDKETDLYYYGARYYDSSTGRFISSDPLLFRIDGMSQKERNQFLSDPQNLNMYTYVRNNPVNYIDPTGENAETISERFEGFGRMVDGFVGGTASYYINRISKFIPVTFGKKIAKGYSLSLGINSGIDVYDGAKQLVIGEQTKNTKVEEFGKNLLTNLPVTAIKNNFVAKTLVKNVTNLNTFEETFGAVGKVAEGEARSVMTIDVTKHEPIENTQLIQGPNTLLGTLKQTLSSVKVKIDSFISDTKAKMEKENKD